MKRVKNYSLNTKDGNKKEARRWENIVIFNRKLKI